MCLPQPYPRPPGPSQESQPSLRPRPGQTPGSLRQGVERPSLLRSPREGVGVGTGGDLGRRGRRPTDDGAWGSCEDTRNPPFCPSPLPGVQQWNFPDYLRFSSPSPTAPLSTRARGVPTVCPSGRLRRQGPSSVKVWRRGRTPVNPVRGTGERKTLLGGDVGVVSVSERPLDGGGGVGGMWTGPRSRSTRVPSE